MYGNNYGVSAAAPVITPSYDGVTPFADPFVDIASIAMPASIPAMFRHAEYFALADPTLREAINRTAAYFLTDLEVTGDLGPDEQKSQRETLVDEMQVMDFLHEVGLNYLVYGNVWISVIPPIVRYVVCPAKMRNGNRCGAKYRFAEFYKHDCFDFTWRNAIHGRCPSCGYTGMFHDQSRPPEDVQDESRPLILRCWNPHDIRVRYRSATGETTAYDWIIPAEDRTEAKLGQNKSVLEGTPWPWLMAAVHNQNVRFDTDYIKHWREPALAGLRFRGFGVPRSIVNYRQVYYNAILRRMQEVLALGHVVPMRVISPANTPSRSDDGDIMKNNHLGGIRHRIQGLIAAYRADPSSIQSSPIPLQMQALGADARQLIPADILTQGQDVMLNGMGVPVDFYRGNMTTQNAPIGLRLIDRTWAPFVSGLNRVLHFIGDRAQFLLKWEKATYKLQRVSLVDDIETNQLRVQMAQAGLLSRSTAIKQVGSDFEDETKQKIEDQKIENRIQTEAQEEQDAYGFSKQLANAQPAAGGAGQPGQPGAPGGDPSQAQAQGGQPQGDPSQAGGPQAAGTPAGQDPLAGIMPQPGESLRPEDFLARADQAADYLLSVPPGAQRNSQMRRLDDGNKFFYQLVKGRLDEKRSEMRSKGQQAQQQAQYGTQG